MAIDRRGLLLGTLAILSPGWRLRVAAADAAHAEPEMASAFRAPDGSYGVALLDASGQILRLLPLQARGHAITSHRATGWAVVFARQPGEFALAFSWRDARAPQLIVPPDGRCYFGHGVFSDDGRLLYATENDIEAGRGLLGIYDVSAGFRRIGEIDTAGIGPHELVWLPDRRTLAVANGGYETLPATGRTPIDITAMRPSLAFIDARTGDVRSRHELGAALRPLSLRHLVADGQGRVWIGAQWEGAVQDSPACIGVAGPDASLVLLDRSAALGPALKGYVGSMAASADGRVIAASAPRAGRILMFDAGSATLRGSVELADGCGLSASGRDRIAASSGRGSLVRCALDGTVTPLAEHRGYAFDNHVHRLAEEG